MNKGEDTYSMIFTALKNPIRRNILRRLSTSPATYKELLSELGIENELLNGHIESLSELILKGENNKYTLSELGKAGSDLIKKIENSVHIQTEKINLKRIRMIQILSVILIVGLSITTLSLYLSNLSLNMKLADQQDQLNTTILALKNYSSLFDSNITPPISKINAVARALSYDGWNSSRLVGMEIDVSLDYVRIFVVKDDIFSFETLKSVVNPAGNYSPMAEYNVTIPGVSTQIKGTMWYRYVWTIVIHNSSGKQGVPPPGLYWVDASDGELFKESGLGILDVS